MGVPWLCVLGKRLWETKIQERQVSAHAALRAKGVAVFDIAENLLWGYRIFHFVFVWMQK